MRVTEASPRTRQLMAGPERKASIVAAAARAFARGGYAGTSMEEIADGAGITKLIVYRHFGSKEELYRGVLQTVSDRIAEVFLSGLPTERLSGIGVNAFLTVAREDPDGFRLLWRQAAREREFALYADQLRERTVTAVRFMLGGAIDDTTVTRWASETVVSFIVEATLNWLDTGDSRRDAEFEGLTTSALQAMVRTWAARVIPVSHPGPG